VNAVVKVFGDLMKTKSPVDTAATPRMRAIAEALDPRLLLYTVAVCVLTLAGVAQAQCFGKQIQHIGRLEPWKIIAADFNHDGFPDLAVGTLVSGKPAGRVTVFIGDGRGTFLRPGNRYDEAFGLEDLAAGDFNNDGNLDIIDVNWDFYNLPQGVGILLGNGDGTFTRHTHRESPWELDHVVVGDFNGDGNLDAVVWSTQTDFFGVYMGNGDGTLLGPFHVPTGGPYPPFQILSADFTETAFQIWPSKI
jgi:hypothetical protein